MATVEFQKIQKTFGKQNVLQQIDLKTTSGEFVVLVGPSGCGKSTLLRILAGLENPTSGNVLIDGKPVNHLSPKERGIAMVFQNYALYPHMTVRQNLAFGLKLSKVSPSEIDSRVNEAAKVLAIEDHLNKKPGKLSGGQKQRVAMGRAMVRQPKVFLFDEPLSNLDAQLRVKMRAEISLLHRRLGCTVIYVTHDQVEAMTLADRIAVMYQGKIEQLGPPLEVYHHPKTKFVASFIGTPPMNFVPHAFASHVKMPSGAATVGFRPESITLSNGNGRISLGKGSVKLVEPLGSAAHLHITLGGESVVCEVREHFPAIDEAVELYVDTKSLFFFDPAGMVIGGKG